jgi:outer membrane autotransporter protein
MNGLSGVFGSLAGAGTVTNGGGAAATLTAGGNGTDTTFSGVIQDGASAVSLTKTGAGTLTLSGTSTYTGATLLSAGNLIVNGSIVTSSGLTVAPGALVGGNGALPSTTINGTLSPGNSIGVININGNLVFGAGSIYIVEVSPTNADRTNVTGTASLAGELRLIFGPGTYSSNSYTILSAAGGRSGTFNTTTTQGLPATLTASVTYTATDALLLVTLISQINPVVRTLAGTTPNQQAVAAAQDAAFNAGKPAITGLFGLSPAQLPPALDALSGEVHASTASVLVDESAYVRSAILGRLRQASYGGDASMASLSMGGPQVAFAGGELDSALAYAKSPMVTKAPLVAPVPSYDIVYWAQGFGAWGKFNSDGNAAALNRDLAGFITGFDGRFGNWRGGIAAGYTGSRNNTDGRGSANVDTGHIAAYGGWNVGAVNLRAGGAYAFHTIDTDRTIVFPGFFDRATAHYQGGTGQVFGEAGYGLAFGKLAVEPFAGGAWVRLDTDAFSERGGAAALNVAGNSFEVGYSTLGVRAASLIPLGDMVLVPRASAAWQHAFNDVTPDATVAFQNAGVAFTVAGVPIARDALLAEAGLDLAITPRATIGVSYTGQIASNVQDHAARGKFAWKF